jgi:phosphoenolpyruvate carboxykinase (ATP)
VLTTETTLTAVLSYPLAKQGIDTNATIHANLGTAQLVEQALIRSEGQLTVDGALLVDTGKFTGRSVKDKYVVRDSVTENTINWGAINQPMSTEHWANLKADFLAAVQGEDELFVADLFGGSQAEYRVNVRVITQMAWHSLFVRTLLVRPSADELASFAPEYTIINLPSFKADPVRHGCRSDTVISVNFTEKLILIGNTEYSGEMKKGVFGLLNFLLPAQGVMPMHCSANIGPDGTSAIFFGLSGTIGRR